MTISKPFIQQRTSEAFAFVPFQAFGMPACHAMVMYQYAYLRAVLVAQYVSFDPSMN